MRLKNPKLHHSQLGLTAKAKKCQAPRTSSYLKLKQHQLAAASQQDVLKRSKKHCEVPAKLASANAQLRACRKTLAAATLLSSTMTRWTKSMALGGMPHPVPDVTGARTYCRDKKDKMIWHQESRSRPIHEAIVHAGDIQWHSGSQHDQALSLAGAEALHANCTDDSCTVM